MSSREESWANIVSLRNPDGSLDGFRLEETLPLLTDEQIDAIRPFAEEEEIPAGQLVLREGQTELDFLVVLKGAIEFSTADSSGKKPIRIVLIPERSFASDLSLLTNTPLAADGLTTEATRILRVRHSDFRRLLSAEPDLATVILRAFVLRQSYKLRHGVGAVVLIGKASDPDIQKLRTFLSRSDYPHKLIEPDTKDQTGKPMLASYGVCPSDLPAAFIRKGCVLKKPSVFELASELGLVEKLPSDHVYDLAIAGSGPAGLAAAVSGASEGLDTIVFDGLGPGGQAGSSSRIENYLGFPTGLTGQELASRAAVQALKFGVRLVSPRSVERIVKAGEDFFELTLQDGARVLAKAVVLATGAVYRALDIPEYGRFFGRGIHHAATLLEAQLCVGEDIVIVGGGNSAGQAALYLSKTTAQVHLLVTQDNLSSTMSKYLVERLQASPKIRIYFETKLTALTGHESLESVEWRSADGRSSTKPIRNIFVMIGAVPNTEWLKGCIQLDSKGYIVTKPTPLFETSQPGVFAVGDVRAGSSKRVAAAVGEGSVVIQQVHHYLARDLARASSVEAESVPPPIQAIVDAKDRTDADRKLDASRHPGELLAFLGLKPGMRVAELSAGAGYTTELLARAVGPTGKVWAQNNAMFLEFIGKPWAERLARPAMKNVVRSDRELDAPLPPDAKSLDAVVIMLWYHDSIWVGADRDKMNKAVFDSLEHGGQYVVVDHSAVDGHGKSDVKTLHRIDELSVIREVERAGFTHAADADFLRNPADTRDWSDSPSDSGEKRGTSDRFVAKFVKS